MKKLLLTIFAAITLILSNCGTYTVTSGVADEAAVCFIATEQYEITVNIDGTTYEKLTVKDKEHRAHRNVKKITEQQIILTPGRHNVKVMKEGVEIYNHEIFVSNSEVKIIRL